MFFEDGGDLDLLVAIAEVEAVGVGAFGLGADADGGDADVDGPLFYGVAKLLADALAAHVGVDDEPADHHDGIRLQVSLDGRIDPSDYGVLHDRGEGCVFVAAGEGFDAGADLGGAGWVAEGCTQGGYGVGVSGVQGADGQFGHWDDFREADLSSGIERHMNSVA